MSDLINRQQAIDVLEEQLDYLFMLNKKDNPTAESKWQGVNWAKNTIAELPTAEPKVGIWKIETEGNGWNEWYVFNCPSCGSRIKDNMGYHEWKFNYCPNCGTKMEGRKE